MERNWDFRSFFSLFFREKLYTVKTCIQKHFIECKLQAMILCFIKTQRRRWATTPNNDVVDDDDLAVTAVRALDIYKLFVFAMETICTEWQEIVKIIAIIAD